MRTAVALAIILTWASPALAAPPSAAYEALMREAEQAMYRDRLDEALAKVDQGIAKEPEHVDAYLVRGETLLRMERFKDAEAAFEMVIAKDPEMGKGWDGLGMSQFRDGRPDKAIETFQKALRLKPEDAGFSDVLAFIYFEVGKPADAQKVYEAALAKNPKRPELTLGLGRALYEQGRREEGLAKIASLQPQAIADSMTSYRMGTTYLQMGETAKGIAEFRRAVGAKPKDMQAQIGLVQALVATDDIDGAAAAIAAVRSLDPEAANALARIAGLAPR